MGRHGHHVGDLFRRFERGSTLGLGVDAEAAEFEAGRAFADAEIDAAVGYEVKRCQALGSTGRMIVVGDDLANPVPEPDTAGARGGGGEKHFRGGAMRILFEEVVLHLPGIVNAGCICEHHLFERVMYKAMVAVLLPWLGQLQFVEDAKSHSMSPAKCVWKRPW